MNRSIRVTPEAEADIAEAFSWYEEADLGLGSRFVRAVRDAATLTGENAEMFAPVHQDVRRILLRKFAYSLFYVVEADAVVILGCLHGRCDPQFHGRIADVNIGGITRPRNRPASPAPFRYTAIEEEEVP